MATRKVQSAPIRPLPDEVVWLLACLVGELGLLVAHDGKLPTSGAAHFASEIADDVLAEFHRRFPRS